MTLSDFLFITRVKDLNLCITHASNLTGIARQTIYKVERGEWSFTQNLLEQFSKGYQIPMHVLLSYLMGEYIPAIKKPIYQVKMNELLKELK